MSTIPGVEIEFLSADKAQSRGLVVRLTSLDSLYSDSSGCRARIDFPDKWHTVAQIALNGERLHVILVGHLYARSANTFDSGESLGILGRIYRQHGIEAVRAEIGGGMFALFVVDLEKQQLHAMCDLLACMPLFYTSNSASVTLATNQFDLQETHKLSRNSCLEYLRFGYLPFSSSLFEGVKRLGPGQILTADLASGSIARITEEQLPSYPILSERIGDIDTAVQKLDRAFTRFYSRFNGEPVAAGLSGGYDSRLIAAFANRYNLHLVTFNYPGTSEADVARQVAGMLGSNTHVFEIPEDAPSRFMADFVCGMQTLDNLGSSHVFALLDALVQGNPAYILDGFLGDTIVGGEYYYKLSGGLESTARVLALRDNYKEGIRSLNTYTDICLSGYGRGIELSPLLEAKAEDYVNRVEVESLVSKQLGSCHSHADMVELLKYRFRGRCLISCGPITFLRRNNTLCPYYDTDVFLTCMSIDKRIRAGERLYNAFWRYRFPELTDIPKENTGGRPSQSDVGYRLTHFRKALQRRVEQRLPSFMTPRAKAGGDLAGFTELYCRSAANKKYFHHALQQAHHRLHGAGFDGFLDSFNNQNIPGQLFLRMVSLAALLGKPNS